jgi:hypothetical protein
MNSPNPQPKAPPSILPVIMAIIVLCSFLFLLLPALSAAANTPGRVQGAHDHAGHGHALAQGEAGPIVIDFGNAPPGPEGAPQVAGMEQWLAQNGVQTAAADDVTGPKKVVVLRVYFQDYANTSRYTLAEVEGMFDELDQLWRDTSYNQISIVHEVSDLFQLPDNRTAYIDDLPPCEPDPAIQPLGDLSCGAKFTKVMNDAIDNSPAGLDWTNVDAVFVVMAETNASQFHRGQSPGKCTVKMGPGGGNKSVGCAIFSENPSETDRQVWGRWAHEMGHAFQEGGPAHPSNYNSEFELMDSNYPGQTGVFEKQAHVAFPGWLPPFKYAETDPTKDGQQVCLWAMEYDPAGKPNPQAIKAKISDSLYYLVSVRRRVLGDDLNGDFASGIPDEGVLIERVVEGAGQWVEVRGKGGNRNSLWKAGDVYTDAADGIYIHIDTMVDADNYCVTVRYTQNANKPDVGMHPWTSPPGDTWETTDIWVDSPVNGYGTYRYNSWNDLSGNPVPRGNGDDPAVGMTNRLYARVRNVGTVAATDVVVNFEVTDPLGVGIAGANGWAAIGTVDKNSFPGLASIAAGSFVDVYVEWTPNIELTEEQIAEGIFNFHTCVRVKINPVAGETALGNQDGDREQENISYFQAVSESDGGAVYNDVIRLRNDDLVNPKFFYLDYESDLPAAWELEINGGVLGLEVPPGEVYEIPVMIKPNGPAVVGSIFGVDVSASSFKTLVNDLNAKDVHGEFAKLGGVRVEARVLEKPRIECSAERMGEVAVQGKLSAENFDQYYDDKNPPMALIQGVDENRKVIPSQPAWSAVPVNRDGSFSGFVYWSQPEIKEVLCLFAGTDKLATASSGYVPVHNPNDPPAQCSELFSPTQIPSPGLIHFDDLGNAVAIKDHYVPTHGVHFEESDTTRAITYADNPAESTTSHSAPNVAMNDAVSPNTSNGVPMQIRFDTLKTHVGLYMGNGSADAPATGVLSAYDSAGILICQVSNQPVPDDVAEFIGIHDAAGRIASVSLDYGATLLAEVIDDLYFAPYTPPGTPTDTPTPTNTPTNTPTPTNSPTPTPTNTPVIPSNPIVAAPYFPVNPVIVSPLLQKDLSIHGIEITQGIQCFDTSKGLASCPDNSLPVVTKKDATARIYLRYQSTIIAGGSMNNVPVRLHIFANGVEYIANASGRATTAVDQGVSDSADIYFNVNFSNDIPVSFYAVVDPDNAIVETSESNNRYPASGTIDLTFRKRDALKIVGQRLRYHPSGYGGTQHAGGWAVNGGAADWLEQVLPLRNNAINYSLASGYLDWTGTLSNGDGQHDLISYLNLSYILQHVFNALFGTGGAYLGADHVYGWAPNAGYSGGHADMPVYPHAGGLGVVGIGTDRTSDGANTTDDPGGGALIFAHELVHDYDILHTDTADACGSADSNSDFPYSSSSIQEYGFNPITGKIYDPATTHDLMSYCPAGGSKDGWIAPFTWSQMFNRLAADSLMAASANAPYGVLQATGAAKSLVVYATVYNPELEGFNPEMPGKLGDLHLVETGVEFGVPGGPYAIQLRIGETVVATHTFGVSFQSEYSAHGAQDGQGDPAPLAQADVSFIIPWVEGATSVVLAHNDQVIDQRTVSANAPAVTVTNPAAPAQWEAGTIQNLAWEGSDADGDSLSYSVLFSADGGQTWSIMATGLTTPSLAIEVDALAGTQDGRFRIVATDGVNTGAAESASVQIANKAPIAQINDPVAGRTFLPGALVVLQGAALDLEDGRLPDEALHWSSDLQGDLGVGPSLPVNHLQPGEHVITLSVADSNGVPATAQTKITVGFQTFLPAISK